jgi:hypothetical protein
MSSATVSPRLAPLETSTAHPDPLSQHPQAAPERTSFAIDRTIRLERFVMVFAFNSAVREPTRSGTPECTTGTRRRATDARAQALKIR